MAQVAVHLDSRDVTLLELCWRSAAMKDICLSVKVRLCALRQVSGLMRHRFVSKNAKLFTQNSPNCFPIELLCIELNFSRSWNLFFSRWKSQVEVNALIPATQPMDLLRHSNSSTTQVTSWPCNVGQALLNMAPTVNRPKDPNVCPKATGRLKFRNVKATKKFKHFPDKFKKY